MLISSVAVVAATPPKTTTSDLNPSGYSTYIVAFNDKTGQISTMAQDQVTGFINSHNGKILYRYSVINGMAVTIPDDQVDELKAMKNVMYVEKDQTVHVQLDKAVPIIGAPEVWDTGYTGKGVKVAVIDTGIDASHPDLNGNKVVGWVDYVQGKTTPYDDHGHGTHVSSIIAGTGSASDGKYKGVAPEASLIGVKVLSKDGSGSNTNIIKGIDWAVQNHAQVISMSLGGSQHSQATDDAINNAIKAGVVCVIAAGNSGPGAKTIACPGDNPNAITVGAVDKNDTIASFSSRGPTYDGRIKPDVSNIGVSVIAARATGTNGGKPLNDYYTAMSGTSMATPMTSGVVALLLQANPKLTPAQVKDILTKTAKPLGGNTPNNNYGYGRVQAKAALDYLKSGKVPSPTPTPTPDPSATPVPTVTPTPTPNPSPGDYSVSLIPMFARYNGQAGRMDQFRVQPGTTIEQGIMIGNMGNAADSYTISVSGIPDTWYKVLRYNGETVQPQQAAYMTLYVQPVAGADAGSYKFTVTATSNSQSDISSTASFTINIVSPSTAPSATPTITPTVTPTVKPTVTPSPPAPPALAGKVANGQEYYTYIVPEQPGQVSAEISWPGAKADLNMYLYDPSGTLVAKSEQHSTKAESIHYNATKTGNYLLKISMDRTFEPVEFTGTVNQRLQNAYVRSGSLQQGQSVSMNVTSDGRSDVSARLCWAWSFNTLGLTLYDQNGKTLARSTKMQDGLIASYAHINYTPSAPGTYVLKIDAEKLNGNVNYKLVTPYQL